MIQLYRACLSKNSQNAFNAIKELPDCLASHTKSIWRCVLSRNDWSDEDGFHAASLLTRIPELPNKVVAEFANHGELSENELTKILVTLQLCMEHDIVSPEMMSQAKILLAEINHPTADELADTIDSHSELLEAHKTLARIEA